METGDQALLAPWGAQTGAMDVYRTPAAALDSLVTGRLQPPAGFVEATRRALGDLGTELRKRGGHLGAGTPTWRVLKTVKVGARPELWGSSMCRSSSPTAQLAGSPKWPCGRGDSLVVTQRTRHAWGCALMGAGGRAEGGGWGLRFIPFTQSTPAVSGLPGALEIHCTSPVE